MLSVIATVEFLPLIPVTQTATNQEVNRQQRTVTLNKKD